MIPVPSLQRWNQQPPSSKKDDPLNSFSLLYFELTRQISQNYVLKCVRESIVDRTRLTVNIVLEVNTA